MTVSSFFLFIRTHIRGIQSNTPSDFNNYEYVHKLCPVGYSRKRIPSPLISRSVGSDRYYYYNDFMFARAWLRPRNSLYTLQSPLWPRRQSTRSLTTVKSIYIVAEECMRLHWREEFNWLWVRNRAIKTCAQFEREFLWFYAPSVAQHS